VAGFRSRCEPAGRPAPAKRRSRAQATGGDNRETASVEYADGIGVEQLIAAVEAAGYQAALPTVEAETDQPAEQDPTGRLRNRLIISALLSVPVLLISMISSLQFDNWQWLSLQLATPVVLWGAWPFHRAASANLKHATATMDTLISVGTLSAWLWSLYALFSATPATTGCGWCSTQPPPPAPERTRSISRPPRS
jgi:Cu+-exporting ATPase